MITVVYCTKEPNKKHIDHIIKSSGLHKHIEVIEIINNSDSTSQYFNGGQSLTKAYNQGLKEATNDIVVFCHDDIEIETKQWGNKLLKQFKKNPEYGIIGVAGSKTIPISGKWWENQKKMYGRVKHTNDGKSWLSAYSDDLGQELEEVVNVDGVFFAIDKTKIKKDFDETVEGFHFYDVTFSFENHLMGTKVGVSTLIRINHHSIGLTNDEWERNRKIFSEKYHNKLPISLPESFIHKKMNVLIDDSIFNEIEINNFINRNLNVYVLSKNSKNYTKYGFKNYLLTEPNGYKIGDGKWILKTQNGDIVSKDKTIYKISNFEFDVIHISNTDMTLLEFLNKLYPSSKIIPYEQNIGFNPFEGYRKFINEKPSEEVTFIIPTINRETLTRSVDSLINQTNPNWKCKIIFDGVEPIEFSDKRVESIGIEKIGLIGPKNGQAGLVRNVGIDKVDTKWVAFLDDDDTINPNYVDILLNEYYDKDFVIFKMIYENGLVLPKNNEIAFANVGISFAYRKELDVKFENNRDGEDYDFIINLKNKTNNYVVSNHILYNVRH